MEHYCVHCRDTKVLKHESGIIPCPDCQQVWNDDIIIAEKVRAKRRKEQENKKKDLIKNLDVMISNLKEKYEHMHIKVAKNYSCSPAQVGGN
jgi:hypothetical protein